MGPYKCPDCGAWWAGFEHRCSTAGLSTSTVDLPPIYGGTFSFSRECDVCRTPVDPMDVWQSVRRGHRGCFEPVTR